MNHFVTGGAGFIGSRLVDRLMEEGNGVTVYDNLSSGRKEWIEHHLGRDGFRFIHADLLDLDTLKQAMPGHQVVWHLGANTDIVKGNRITDLDLKNCTIATYNTLEAMRQNGIDKILFISTGAVYGEAQLMPTPEDAGPLLPISLYGAAKLACEGLINAYSHLFGIKAWIFRFGNAVLDKIRRGVIYHLIQKLKQDPSKLEILGDGNQEKSFCLLEDTIDGMFCAFHNSNSRCDVFNLSCDSTSTVTRVAQIVVEEMGLKNVEFIYTGSERGWPGDIPVIRLSVEKMKRLGWQAQYTSDEAVRIATRRLLAENETG
ncbi:MAG: UDP-glucose 4-epimerase [Chloroflexi bacterium]|nr:MAG: UDP-glucose 4-epimerase [Chloroflexota bacterium]